MDSTGIGGRDSDMNASWLGGFDQKRWIKTIESRAGSQPHKMNFCAERQRQSKNGQSIMEFRYPKTLDDPGNGSGENQNDRQD